MEEMVRAVWNFVNTKVGIAALIAIVTTVLNVIYQKWKIEKERQMRYRNMVGDRIAEALVAVRNHEQIGKDIDQYIEEHDMGIKRDTEEYAELLNEFCFFDLTDTTKRFYEAYASVCLSNPTVKSTDDAFADKTIGEIRGENQETTKRLEEAEKNSKSQHRSLQLDL